MGRFWILRLCVTLVILTCCPVFVLTVAATSNDQPTGDSDPALTVADWLVGDRLGLVAQRRPKKEEADNCGDNLGTTSNCSGDNGDDNADGDNNRSSKSSRNGNDNESDSFVLPPLSFPRPQATAPRCTTPGEGMTFASSDEKATVQTFATINASLRVIVTPSYDVLALPLVQGKLPSLLIYDVLVSPCDGGTSLVEFPAEVNLTIHYAPEDLLVPDGSAAQLFWVDPVAGTGQQVAKQTVNATQHAIGATITRAGRYIVYESR